jgi:hypothetical protein
MQTQDGGPVAKRSKRAAARDAAKRIASGANDADMDQKSNSSSTSSGATEGDAGSESDADSESTQRKKVKAPRPGIVSCAESTAEVYDKLLRTRVCSFLALGLHLWLCSQSLGMKAGDIMTLNPYSSVRPVSGSLQLTEILRNTMLPSP